MPNTSRALVALLISSLVNAVLFFRIFERAYFPQELNPSWQFSPDPDAIPHSPVGRVPISMLIPLWIAAFSLLAIGLANNIITGWLGEALNSIAGWGFIVLNLP